MNAYKTHTDDTLRETVVHGNQAYPFAYYPENIWEFDFHRIDWHWHHELEFLLVDKGMAICFAGDNRIELSEGSGIFINSGTLHRYEAKSSAFCPNIVFDATLLAPEELLQELHRIEQMEGRERKLHWGPRTLDLDIIFYDDLVYASDDLAIPHIDMENRYFVLKPLSELAPNFRHPITHKTVAQMLAELPVDLTEGSEA